MKAEELLKVMHLAEKLKDATRHCYTSGRRHESVAEHSWRISLLAYFVKDEFPEADMDKVIKMCLIHDLGEAFTGDIPSFIKTEADSKLEDRLLYRWVETLPEPYRREMKELYDEMNALETLEARIYKCMDKLEAVIQHNESDITTWAGNEYKLNVSYAEENVQFSEYLKTLRQAIKEETLQKIENSKVKVIYFDMDGVLADFAGGVRDLLGLDPAYQLADPQRTAEMFRRIGEYDSFFRKLKPVEGALELFEELRRKYDVEILTGIPPVEAGVPNARENKVAWIKQYIDPSVPVHTCIRPEKKNYCTGRNCLLIDDNDNNLKQWEQAGGTAVRFTTAAQIRDLFVEKGIL